MDFAMMLKKSSESYAIPFDTVLRRVKEKMVIAVRNPQFQFAFNLPAYIGDQIVELFRGIGPHRSGMSPIGLMEVHAYRLPLLHFGGGISDMDTCV